MRADLSVQRTKPKYSQQPPGVVQNWCALQCSKKHTEQCGYDHAPVTRGRMRAQLPLPHGPVPGVVLQGIAERSAHFFLRFCFLSGSVHLHRGFDQGRRDLRRAEARDLDFVPGDSSSSPEGLSAESPQGGADALTGRCPRGPLPCKK